MSLDEDAIHQLANHELNDPLVDKEDLWYLHERLHGVSLVHNLFERAMQSSYGDSVVGIDNEDGLALVRKYPQISAAYDRADDAIADLYQALGRHRFSENFKNADAESSSD